MVVRFPASRRRLAAFVVAALTALAALRPDAIGAGVPPAVSPVQGDVWSDRPPDFEQQRREQEATDRAWRAASAGHMRMEKILYRSRAGDLEIPAFVFQPLEIDKANRHAAIVWVHENIRGHLYEHYIPYIREATARGYVVIAPEYRGSIGYGRHFYEAIDYGGAEVDDVVTAVEVLRNRYPHVDPERVGIVGWSHGGMIALLAVFRHPAAFNAAAAIVPVANLFHRLTIKGDQHRLAIDPLNRFGGSPAERPEVYRDRSPLYHVDRLQIPLLVHVARNDEDVTIEESMPLVTALRSRKPGLADVKVYESPTGGHLFDRLVDPETRRPSGGPDQRDSWRRLWTFFEVSLRVAEPALP
ncbi:MAG: alpha/beta hydrolase family protein [Vicinamibacterales bacterium]